jgi:hypothetical protein
MVADKDIQFLKSPITKQEAIQIAQKFGGGSSNDKGYFSTESALTTALPTGQNGWYAVVGATDTFWIWDGDTSDWVNSGTSSTGNVVGPDSSTNNNIAVFDGTTGKLIKDGGATLASKQDALGFTAEDSANKATDFTTVNDTLYPSVEAVNEQLALKQDILAEGAFVDGDKTKLDGIEAGADVTDTTNVDAAGATMNTDTSLVGNGYFLDEDGLTSNDETKVPSQQSVKAYVDNGLSGKEDSLGFTPENVANKENTTIDTNTTKYPTVNLLKTGLDTKQDQDNLLDDISTLSGNGIIVRVNANTAESRSIVAGSSKVAITNGNGVSGNPSIDIGTLLASDIPNLDASKITTGTIDIARLPAGAISKLITVADEAARFALTTGDVQNGDSVKQTDTDVIYYVVDDTNLDNASGYEVYSAETDWSLISNKPQNIVDIAAITPVNDDIIQVKSGGYVARSVSQFKTDLSLGNLANLNAVGSSEIDDNAVITGKIANSNVTLAKIADISNNTFIGNDSGAAAAPQELTGSEATALLSNVVGDSGAGGTKGLVPAPASGDAAANKYLKADGTWDSITTSEVDESTDKNYVTDAQQTVIQNTSGTNTGDQTITLTGDVIGSGTGSFAATIANDAVSLDKIANAAANDKLLGSGNTGSGGSYAEITLGTNLSMSGTTLNASGANLPDGDKGDITVSSSGTVWTIDNGVITDSKVASGIDAAKLADGSVSNTELQYINSLLSNAQDQLDLKAPLASPAFTGTVKGVSIPFTFALSDETTEITTGTAKITFRVPYACTLTDVRASLTTASSSGLPTFDINENGTSVLSTKLTIDANEKTSTTATTPVVISDSALADDAEITIDIDVAGTGATGAKITMYLTRL